MMFDVGSPWPFSTAYQVPDHPLLSFRTASGSDLLCYGVNLELHKDYVRPIQRGVGRHLQPSFLVVQIPALSLHEYAYYSASHQMPPGQQRAIAAGPSFLAFELWPQVPADSRGRVPRPRLACTLASLFNWEDMAVFRLLAANDSAFDALWPCLRTQVKDTSLDPVSRPALADFSYYKWLFKNVFQQSVEPGGLVPPLSLLEVPARSIMGLVLRKLPALDNEIANQPYFTTNIKAERDSVARHITYFGSGSQRVRRTIVEILQAELRYASTNRPWKQQPSDGFNFLGGTTVDMKLLPGPNQQASKRQAEHTAGAEPPPSLVVTPTEFAPALRLLAYFRDPSGSEQTKPCECNAPTGPDFLLPGNADHQQLSVLNQLGRQLCADATPMPGDDRDFRADRYDIRIVSPFVLGGRGASFKAEYINYDTARIPSGLSLVEYVHHMQDGRDNFIRIAYIGVLAPSNEKAVHVRQARRVLQKGRSYLQYEEHIEVLKPSPDFVRSLEPIPGEYYAPFYSGRNGSQPLEVCSLQRFFTRIEAVVRQFSIHPEGECVREFWPRQEQEVDGTYPLLKIPLRYFDADGREIGISEHEVQFLRRDFFGPSDCPPGTKGATPAELLNPASDQYLGKLNDGRRLIPLGGKVVALTDSAPATDNTNAQSLNKPNRMATKWAEWVYHLAIRTDKMPPGANVFDYATYLVNTITPCFNCVNDHVQGVAGRPLASLLEYSPHYLKNRFGIGPGQAVGNDKLLLMLQHTEDFLADTLRDWNGRPITAASAAGPLYADLQGGMARIRGVFKEVGERLGGLANPDPVLEHVAGIAQNLALPPIKKMQDVVASAGNVLEKIRRPLDILNGDAAELLNIKIVRLLRETLDEEDTPQFLLQKFNAGYDTLATTINSLKSPVIQRALAAVQTAQQQATVLANRLTQAEQELLGLRSRLQQTYEAALAQVPDLDKIKSLAMAQLDVQRFELIGKAAGSDLTAYVSRELAPVIAPFVRAAWHSYAVERRLDELRDYVLLVEAEYQSALLKEIATYIQQALAPPTLASGSAAQKKLDEMMSILLTPGLLDNLEKTGKVVLRAVEAAAATVEEAKALAIAVDQMRSEVVATWELLATDKQLQAVDYLLLHYTELRRLPNGIVVAELQKWDRAVQVLRLSLHLQHQYFVQRRQQVQEAVGVLQRSAWLLATKEVHEAVGKVVEDVLEDYQAGVLLANTQEALTSLERLPDLINAAYEAQRDALWQSLVNMPEYQAATQALEAYTQLAFLIKSKEGLVRVLTAELRQELERQTRNFLDRFRDEVENELRKLGGEELQQALAAYEQARRFLQTPMRQDLVYDWQTAGFTDVNLGIIRFIPQQDPPTRLKLHASTSLVVDASQLPAVTTSVVTRTDTAITDFAISFLGVLTVDFARIAFQAGSGRSSNLDLRLKGVRFEGPLTFIQALQDTLAGLVDAFLPLIQEQRITIAYQSPPFSIAVPGFAFLNLSFGIGLDLYFNRNPMRATFRLALPENKAMVAAGILGGAFYMSLTVTPTEGVVQIEMALEMGALLAFSLGPIRGEVRFMAGLYYLKRERQVVMEGYFIAEGNLKVWFIRVSARLYMGVRSYGSYVEGRCVVSYSVKIGFLKKSFTASYVKTIAGAASESAEPVGGPVGQPQLAVAFATLAGSSKKALVQPMTTWLSSKTGESTWEDKFQLLDNKQFDCFCTTYF